MSTVIRPGARNDPATRWFAEARFGMFIHFNPEYQVARRHGVKFSDYPRIESLILREVNPERFSAAKWLDVAEQAGCRYVAYVAKHGPGFCWWDTKTTDFKITRTAFGRDVLREVSAECQRRGMPLEVYLNPGEWHNRHMPRYEGGWGVRSWPREDDDPCWDRAYEYMAAQLTEILTGYGPIAGIWFDGSDHSEIQWRGRKLYYLIKRLQPNCLVNDRCGYGDYLTPEFHMREDVDWRNYLVEQCTPASADWQWSADDWRRSAVDIVDELVRMAGCGSNYLLNVGPRPDGLIDDSEAQRLAAVGRWLKANGDAIYGSEPVRLDGMPDWIRATRPAGRPDVLHVLLRQWPRTSRVYVPGVHTAPAEARLLGGPALRAQLAEGGMGLVVDGLPGDPGDAFVKVLRLEFAGPAAVWEAAPPVRIEAVTSIVGNRPTPLPVTSARVDGVAIKYYQHSIRELLPPDAALVYKDGAAPCEITTDMHAIAGRILQVRGDRHATINWSRLGQRVVWTVQLAAAVKVRVRIRLRCSHQHAGSRYTIRCGAAELHGSIRGNPADHGRMSQPDWWKGYFQLPFIWEDAGGIELPAGRNDLVMEIDEMPYGCFFADVAGLRIVPDGVSDLADPGPLTETITDQQGALS